MKPAKKIWINGKIKDLNAAKLFSFHQGLNYGACVYEGIRCYDTKDDGPSIFRLKDHIARFFYSSSVLGMNLGITKAQLAAAIRCVIKANKLRSAYIRPMAFYSDPKMGINIINSRVTLIIFVWPWEKYLKEDFVSMKITNYRRLDSKTVDIKAKISGYYANGLLGFIEAKKAGFDQPLFLDTSGYVAEGAINNIFFVKNGVVYTSTTRNILNGITRDSIIKIAKDIRVRVLEKDIKPEFLKNVDEIFLTGTGIQLQKVNKVDKLFILKDGSTPITNKISTYYRNIVLGNIKKYKNWIEKI